MCRVTEKLGADMTETERTALMKIAAEMRCALTLITGATYMLTHSKQPKKASRLLPALDEGVAQLLRAVRAAEELARISSASPVAAEGHEGGQRDAGQRRAASEWRCSSSRRNPSCVVDAPSRRKTWRKL